MSTNGRVRLYERLPEIYRIRDDELDPPHQLRQYVALVEEAYGAIRENIESLYHDLFIETCDEWVIPYIGDLLGTSHLSGLAETLRADVANTVELRRRKGTLGAIELLTHLLTRWGVHCVELRKNLVWNQHLNHQRPDKGGDPPYGLPPDTAPADVPREPTVRHRPIRGGTMTLRQPSTLSLLNTPFDPFAHIVDTRPAAFGNVRYNLPNLAIFLWRLKAYQAWASKPGAATVHPIATGGFVVRVEVHPLAEPVTLFNISGFKPERQPPVVTEIDEQPGPMAAARLTEHSTDAHPEAYVVIEPYDETNPPPAAQETKVGLHLHVPNSQFAEEHWPHKTEEYWSIRGANLCAWEAGLQPELEEQEVAIDPAIGRIAIRVDTRAKANALRDHLLLTYTYGAVGPVGAHPQLRDEAPKTLNGKATKVIVVNAHKNQTLNAALTAAMVSSTPSVIEIQDSMTHEVRVTDLKLSQSLIIRAASEKRPIIKLAEPLRFRPKPGAVRDENLMVRLEGLFITRGKDFGSTADTPLIKKAALRSLEIIECTLDPGGAAKLDGTRSKIRRSMTLSTVSAGKFTSPEIIIQRTISGPLRIDDSYELDLSDSIIDAGIGDGAEATFAIAGTRTPTDVPGAMPDHVGPPTRVNSITVFGPMRVKDIDGSGGIWTQRLEVLDDQRGCLKYSYFSGDADRLPQQHACVSAPDAELRFTSETFGHPAYGQLAHTSDFRIRERGPNDDAMGAFGSLQEAHKWRNLQIRYREFMPVGVRPLLVPVT